MALTKLLIPVPRRFSWLRFCLLALLVPLAPGLSAEPAQIDRVIAVVNDNVVLKSEFDERWKQVQQQIASAKGAVPPIETLRKQLLDQLVLENLQLQLAKHAGVRIDDNQLNQALAGLAQQNNMSFEQFTKVLQQRGIYDATRDAYRKELTIQQFQYGSVKRRINISRQEVENYLRSEAGTAAIAPEYHVAHILIPGDPKDTQHAELAQKLYEQIRSGADILQLAASHEILGMTVNGGDLGWHKLEDLPSVYSTIVPKLGAGEVSKPFSSSSGHHIVKVLEIRGGSTLKLDQSKVRHILIKPNEIRTEQQADTLIHELYQRIKKGEDFAEIARRNSEDPNSMVAGGELGWVNDGMLPADFMTIVHKTPVGTMTEPVRLATGWHIIEVEDHRIEDATEENKRNQAMQILGQRKMENELQNWLTEIHDTNYIDIKPDALK